MEDFETKLWEKWIKFSRHVQGVQDVSLFHKFVSRHNKSLFIELIKIHTDAVS
jgi:hypothetical protein